MNLPSDAEQLRFLENLQRVLDEGLFSSSYKYALLLSLAELSVERGDDSGATLRLSLRDVAEKFIGLYWRQAAPYVPARTLPVEMTAGDAAVAAPAPAAGNLVREAGPLYLRSAPPGPAIVLKQNTDRQAQIVAKVAEARAASGGSLATFRANGRAWRALISAVAKTIREQPLGKLQTVGRAPLTFLYRPPGSGETELELLPGVAFCFRRFHVLVRELVQASWIRFLRRIPENAGLLGEGHELGAFLFGTERANLEPFRTLLFEQQRGDCFYCASPLRNRTQVDHFIPWARYGLDLGHNFVLAHADCNHDKRDHLAALRHLERWCARNVDAGEELRQRFDEANLPHDRAATFRITEWAYAQAERVAAQVWEGKSRLVTLAPGWRGCLDAASRAA